VELISTAGLQKALDDIKRGNIYPIYLITGDDDFIIKDGIQNVIDALLPPKEKDLCLDILDESSESWDKIINSLNTYPLLGGKRVIVVKNTKIFFSKFVLDDVVQKSKMKFEAGDREESIRLYRIALGYKGFTDIKEITDDKLDELPGFAGDSKIQQWLKSILEECREQGFNPIPYEDNSDKVVNTFTSGEGVPKQNVLILATQHVDRRKKLYKLINDIGIVIDFSIQRTKRDSGAVEAEERRVLLDLASQLLKGKNKRFGEGAFGILFSKVGYNVGVFTNELEKVISSTEGDVIEIDDVNRIVGRSKEDSVNDLQEAVGQRDFRKASFYLRELLDQGEYHLYLLQSIVSEIRRLILTKEFMEKDLKGKWNPRTNSDAFKKFIYFPIILKKKKEKESKEKEIIERGDKRRRSSLNIYRFPPDVLLNLFRGAENFTFEDLYRALKMLSEKDLRLKTSRVPPALILEEILVHLCFKEEGPVESQPELKGRLRGGAGPPL
jgi:DNA polymerase-3 subunit delta